MQRYWKVQQAVSQWIPADTGIPEGDPWSVAIMIVIAAEWIRGNQKAMDMVGTRHMQTIGLCGTLYMITLSL